MPDTDINKTTTTELDSAGLDYETPTGKIDEAQSKKVFWDNDYWNEGLGMRQNIAIYKESMKAITRWAFGRGLETDNKTKTEFDNITGAGDEDIISILQNLQNTAFDNGDSYAEIIRNDSGTLINLKVLNPSNVRIEYNEKGMKECFWIKQANKTHKRFEVEKIFHIQVDKIANETHGTPKWQACKFELEAKKEAMADWRRISHRSTIRVLYIDSDDTTKITQVRTQYKEAIDKGEVLIIPAKKGEADLEDITLPPIDAFIRWIEYLDREVYKSLGVPKAIVDTADFTEAASKVGYMTFEPVYVEIQNAMEADIWNQLAKKVKFNRPPSLHGVMAEDEQKNTGQVGIQPNEAEVVPQRTE